ncbi:MAG: hypothetical protein M9907_15320 [Burkholderiaceae bacterium]|nr:hypothetical protein [Burkholderiaceae bacterium]
MSNEHSSNDHTVQFDPLMGGGVRVNFFPKQEGDSQEHAERMVKAAERVQILEGGAASYMSATSAPAIEGIAEDGRIASARSQFGSARTGADITEADLIDLGGLQVRIRDAISAGAVVRNHDGSFSIAGSAPSGKR